MRYRSMIALRWRYEMVLKKVLVVVASINKVKQALAETGRGMVLR